MALFKRKVAGASDVAPSRKAPRPVALALQGGGAHGAFQWGVLDRILEDGRLDIQAVTGVSAGGMNGAALVSGLANGGADGARASLDKLWREVNLSGGRNVFGDTAVFSPQAPDWLTETPMWRAGEAFMSTLSPYQFNPFNLNPLKKVLEATVDFEALQASSIKMFIAATAVRKARARIFTTAEITDQVLMASACLPHLFQAVEIDGEPYWDGGYLANPPLWPLLSDDTPDDVLLITLNPMQRNETPRDAGEIVDRLNEIVFNAPLLSELRAIAIAEALIEQGQLKTGPNGPYRHIRIHAIEADGALDDLSLRSKSNTEWSFLNDLKSRGRDAADDWLNSCAATVGGRSSVDLQARFT